MRVLEWTGAALQDLEKIDTWLTAEADPDTAIGMLVAIRARANFLLDFPEGGPFLHNEMHSLRVRNTPYSLVYRVLQDERIEIVRVFHAAQNWRGE